MKVVTLKNGVAPRSRENKRNQSIRILRASMVQHARRMHDVLACEDRRQPDIAVGRFRTADRAATFGRYRGTFAMTGNRQAGARLPWAVTSEGPQLARSCRSRTAACHPIAVIQALRCRIESWTRYGPGAKAHYLRTNPFVCRLSRKARSAWTAQVPCQRDAAKDVPRGKIDSSASPNPCEDIRTLQSP